MEKYVEDAKFVPLKTAKNKIKISRVQVKFFILLIFLFFFSLTSVNAQKIPRPDRIVQQVPVIF